MGCEGRAPYPLLCRANQASRHALADGRGTACPGVQTPADQGRPGKRLLRAWVAGLRGQAVYAPWWWSAGQPATVAGHRIAMRSGRRPRGSSPQLREGSLTTAVWLVRSLGGGAKAPTTNPLATGVLCHYAWVNSNIRHPSRALVLFEVWCTMGLLARASDQW